MPQFTYLGDDEKKRFSQVRDAELNKLFQEIRSLIPRYFIQETESVVEAGLFADRSPGVLSRLFGAATPEPIKKTEIKYTLYHTDRDPNSPDVQIVNFSQDGINQTYGSSNVSKSFIMTYFYGVLSGIELRPKSHSGVVDNSDLNTLLELATAQMKLTRDEFVLHVNKVGDSITKKFPEFSNLITSLKSAVTKKKD